MVPLRRASMTSLKDAAVVTSFTITTLNGTPQRSQGYRPTTAFPVHTETKEFRMLGLVSQSQSSPSVLLRPLSAQGRNNNSSTAMA